MTTIPFSEETYYAEAFSRNLGIITKEEQSSLRGKTVAIAGLGGVGGIYVASLCRIGVGGLHLSDKDNFELANFNRQMAATISTISTSKTDTVVALAKSINPFVKVRAFTEGITEESVEDFLSGTDVVIDAIDFFNIKARRLLHKKAREKGLFVVASVPLGFGGAVLTFDPKGMSFDEYFDINDSLTENQMYVRFGIGFAPALLQRSYFNPTSVDFINHKGASLVTGTLVSATFVSTEIIKILLGRGKIYPLPYGFHFDPYAQKFKRTYLPLGNKGPIQRVKRFVFEHWLLKKKK
jgi:molybdopterin/thiamine biosynthesis adenylyltransferase